MATGTGGSLEEIAQKIMAGQPGTLTAAGSAFKAAYDALNKVATDIPSKVSGVTGTAGQWTGEGADAFVSYAGRMASEIAANASPLSGYQGALSGAASALTTAQGEIQAYLKQAAAYRAQGGTDEAGLAAQAQTILDKLAAAYQQAVSQLQPLKSGTEQGGDGSGGGPTGGNADGGDAKGGPADSGAPKNGGAPPPTAGLPNPMADKAGAPPPNSSKKHVDVPLGDPSKPTVGKPSSLTPPPAFLTMPGSISPTGPRGPSPNVPGLPRLTDGVIGHPSNRVLGRPTGPASPPTTLTSLGRPPGVAPGAVPKLPTVNVPGTAPSGSPAPVPVVGSTALTGSARAAGRARGRGSPDGQTAEEETVAVRPGMPMPMMLSGVGAGDGDGSERRTTLRGDEDWDTSDGVDGAIGRPASLAPRAEG